MNRRLFLQLAAAGATTAFLPSLRRSRAQAAPPLAPRILFVYGMGGIRHFYSPRAVAGQAAPTETQFQLGDLHGPLVPYQSDLIVTDGLDMRSAFVDPNQQGNGHESGGTHAMTATGRLTGSLAGGISIDQLIAKSINSPAPVTRYPMWELDMYDNADGEGGTSYLASGQKNTRVNDARNVLGQFPADLTMQSQAAQAAAAKALAKRKSALDFAANEYASIKTRLSAADKQKLDQHAETLRALEKQLSIGVGAQCQAPSAALMGEVTTASRNPSSSASATERAAHVRLKSDVMSKLMVSALSCDLTRVGLLHFPTHYSLGDVVGFSDGMFGASDPHDLVHKTSNPSDALYANAAALAMHKAMHVEQSRLFANIIGYLKAIPRGDGGTLLDSTIVVMCGQLGSGDHSLTHLPWIVAGSGNGYFRTGRYLKLPRTNNQGPAHNDFFVSLANAMGVPITTFGTASVCKGPLPGMR
jgi:hypothetical protein